MFVQDLPLIQFISPTFVTYSFFLRITKAQTHNLRDQNGVI